MDFQIKEFQKPVIVTNYKEILQKLEEQLEDYKNLVVTEDTLPGCRNAQKELSKARRKINDYRKEKKKEAEKPIKEFEKQCKELIAKIEEVEKPIKDGLQIYADQRREEKRKEAEEIVESVALEYGLEDKFKEQLTVLEKYANLTASKKAVKEDVENRAFALKLAQDKEKDCLATLKTVLDSENSRLTAKMELEDFQHLIDSGFSTAIIIDEIKKRAARIYDQENAATEALERKQEEAKEKSSAPVPEPEVAESKVLEQQYSAVYKVIGSAEELKGVSAYLREHCITYSVMDQRKI